MSYSIDKINQQIASAQAEVLALRNSIKKREKKIRELTRLRAELLKKQGLSAADEWLKRMFSIEGQKYVDDNMFVVFDKRGSFIKITKCGPGEEYKSVGPITDEGTLSHWLKNNQLYAHCLKDFCGRYDKWYQLSLKSMLSRLDWKIFGQVIEGKKYYLNNSPEHIVIHGIRI